MTTSTTSTATTATTPVTRPADQDDQSPARVDPAPESADSAVWVPVAKIIVGVCIVLAGLWWSWQRFATLGHGEYVYTMFGYMLVMMLGGGLLANGVITIVKQIRDGITGGKEDTASEASGPREGTR
ncbi:hypothetical protein [Corynebacterium nuruki]|uniref:hypothetical protein n=1 Tax=Corynebacterium nuruki TaxID=1032851 RepID=UPI002FE0F5DA